MTSVNLKRKAPLTAERVGKLSNPDKKKKVVKTLGGYDSSSESEESIQGDGEEEQEDDVQASAISALEAKNFKFGSRSGKPAEEEAIEDDENSEDDEAEEMGDFMDDEFADDDLEGIPEYDEGGEEEEGDGENQGEQSGEEDGSEDERSGFADAMSKILSKSVAKGNAPILAKDKTIERKLEEEKIEVKARKALVREKKLKADKERAPISSFSISYEKALKKVATRGVVKLFNALRKQNGDSVSSLTKPSSSKKSSVSQMSKSNFLDMLKTSGAGKTAQAPTSKKGKAEAEAENTWDVFKDNYMMGAKMSDWDKEAEEEVENEFEQEMESEYE